MPEIDRSLSDCRYDDDKRFGFVKSDVPRPTGKDLFIHKADVALLPGYIKGNGVHLLGVEVVASGKHSTSRTKRKGTRIGFDIEVRDGREVATALVLLSDAKLQQKSRIKTTGKAKSSSSTRMPGGVSSLPEAQVPTNGEYVYITKATICP